MIINRVVKRYTALINNLRQYKGQEDKIAQIRWMIEELRINLFAQQIGTAFPISEKRINQVFDEFNK